jgi:hypothetical protein
VMLRKKFNWAWVVFIHRQGGAISC